MWRRGVLTHQNSDAEVALVSYRSAWDQALYLLYLLCSLLYIRGLVISTSLVQGC